MTGRIINITPFKNIYEFYSYDPSIEKDFSNFYINLIGNILLFVPLPCIFIYCLSFKTLQRALIASVFVSAVIEIIQFIFILGVAEIDDVVLNGIGAVIGVGIIKLKRIMTCVL